MKKQGKKRVKKEEVSEEIKSLFTKWEKYLDKLESAIRNSKKIAAERDVDTKIKYHEELASLIKDMEITRKCLLDVLDKLPLKWKLKYLALADRSVVLLQKDASFWTAHIRDIESQEVMYR